MSFAHTVVSLNGTWEFQLDPDGSLSTETLQPDRSIPVPMPWQAVFPELQTYSGYAWYRRSVSVEASQLADQVVFAFGAVDYWCQVFVNGTLVGEHEGGYMPFRVDATSALKPGENTLAVRVYDSAQDAIVISRWHGATQQPDGPPFDATSVPHGKQEWYINVGGIWQNVDMHVLPAVSIERVHVTPDLDAASATVDITLAGDLSLASGELQIAAAGATTTVALAPGDGRYQAVLSIATPHLWTLDDPYLYTVETTLSAGDVQHSSSVRFGMRSFGFRDGQFLLNGEPIYLLSALDQDFYPDTIYTVPSDEYLRDQFRKAKELGLNNLRCHIKPADPRYLDIADEMGLLVWAEIPSWRTFWNKSTINPATRDLPEQIHARVEQLLEEMIARDYNHPSIVIWTMVNEDWGTTLPLNANDRAWVRTLYERCKQLDPTRLVVDNSPCAVPWGSNVHVKSDIDDFHVYYAIPDHASAWTHTIDQFALRPMWTYSAHGDIERRGSEPLVLSEFGNWGLPKLGDLRKHHGGDVPWFDLGPWWSGWHGEAGYPEDVEGRFKRLGLESIWPDFDSFAEASQWHQFEAMKYEIEAMRRRGSIAGYVITEFTDCYWESNGLLDFARNEKVYHSRFAEINAPDVIVPVIDKRAFWGGEQATVALAVSHYTGALAAGGTLAWQHEGGEAGGSLEIAPLAAGETRELSPITFTIPTVHELGTAKLVFTLSAGNGAAVARNEITLSVFPAVVTPAQNVTVAAAGTGAAALLPALGAAGVQAAADRDTATLVVSSGPDADLLAWVREGGDLLLLSEGQSPFFWVGGRGGAYGGDWMTSFNWLRPDVHPSLPTENPLGFTYQGTTPNHVILGLPLEDESIHGDVLSGMFSGWVGLPAAYTVQFRYGKGRVVMTTFPLREQAAQHPAAAAMLGDLVAFLASDNCQPTLRGL